MDLTPTGGSSREYWSMRETLNQRRRVFEETLRGVKNFSGGGIRRKAVDGTSGIRGVKTRASRSGNTSTPSVIRIYWA